jgi:hypothetical protein
VKRLGKNLPSREAILINCLFAKMMGFAKNETHPACCRGQIIMTNRPIRRKHSLLAAALVVVCCVGFSATLFAQAVDDDELRAAREHGQSATGVRTANCLIKVRGVEYLRGFCTFIPSEAKDGSFTIVGHVEKHSLQARVVLPANASKDGIASWNGSSGGTTRLVELGQAHSEGACWRVGDAKGNDETRLCAWNSKLAIDEPTPKEPPPNSTDFVYYGMRAGMYDAIEARSGIDTDHARIVTKKSRDAAIILCRGYNHDFTAECIAQTLSLAPTPLLTANCPAGTFTNPLALGDCDHCQPPQDLKFLGKSPHSDQGPDLLIQTRDGSLLDGSWASTYSFASDTFRLLCPETLKKAGTSQP